MASSPLQVTVRFRGKQWPTLEQGFRGFADELNLEWKKAQSILRNELRLFLNRVARTLATRHGRPYSGGVHARDLMARTGKSVRSILNSVVVSGATYNTTTGKIGGDYPLAIHEYGATITSKGKLLAIPLPPALNKNGVPMRKSPKGWRDTFVGRSKRGNLLIFQRRKSGIVPLYVLKDHVTIQPRLGMKKEIDASLPTFVSRAVDKMVASIMKTG
jgi:hypothetical protein